MDADQHAPVRFPDDDLPPPKPFHAYPVRRSSPLASNHNTSAGTSNGRRRVHSVNPGPSPPSTSRTRRHISLNATSSHREVINSVMEDSGIGLFSDEYDLSHQDPKLLQEVQRAVKLKARREARLKSLNSSPSSTKSDPIAPGASSPQTSPLRPAFPSIPPLPPPVPTIRESRESEPGASVTSIPRAGTHPVPSSSDEGTTLDWSGLGTEDDRTERRWTMSITKRKDKELKDKHPSDRAVETRETMYAAKIAQLRTKVSSAALDKAAVACDQLGRRYKLVYDSLPLDEFNILKVARWFAGQEDVVKSSLEQAEPFVWLKDYETVQQASRTLSALIMEEYLVHLRGHSKLQNHQRIASLNSSPSLSMSSPQLFPSPQGSSYFNIGPSLTRKLSSDGRLSYEPLGERRRSIESRKSGESAFSSILSLPVVVAPSAVNNTHRRAPSENGSSRNSLSDHSDDGGRKLRSSSLGLSNRDFLSSSGTKANGRGVLPDKLSPIPDDRADPLSSTEKLSARLPPTATVRSFGESRVRVSLPSVEDLQQQLQQRRQRDAEEEQERREYELKQQLLDASIVQNNRIRQLLNHIAGSVRDYDQAQSSLSTSLNLPYRGLPRELVEAFSHDPAAVTGATRSYDGWRAVDDIHNRVARQRDTFVQFFISARDVDRSSVPASALADPIAALSDALKALDYERQEIAWRAIEVSDVLKSVQAVHAEVKTAYNSTYSHTSVIYPEISTIVDLEESYKDNYQYFWEFAMDVLTFALDTVAPFWRTYGKRVGTDVQDFLIIPLYRNEFTGESKRYLIKTLPQRSLRHWVGLGGFFLGTVALAVFQIRAAVSSLVNFWLPGIPYPYLRRLLLTPFWLSIMLQWWAVVVELSIVVTQLAVVVWWAGWYVNIFT
ncbi:hypothetical protein R3P38DRAFT_3249634 [Favolaschia claudopus]|uniref:Uncharacterized protein n=1 Tax=Favolaschia claudopus TaxID=2862362 RepID=A0AAW0EEU6_9AGAR